MRRPDVEILYEVPQDACTIPFDTTASTTVEAFPPRKLERVELTHVRERPNGSNPVLGNRCDIVGPHGHLQLDSRALFALWPHTYQLTAPLVWLPGDGTPEFTIDRLPSGTLFVTICGWLEKP